MRNDLATHAIMRKVVVDDLGGGKGAHQGLKKSAIVAVVHTNGRRTAQLSRPVVSVGVLSIVAPLLCWI